jgi:hypothetical protein
MSTSDAPGSSGLRRFLDRRQPAAVWLLALLAVLAVCALVLVIQPVGGQQNGAAIVLALSLLALATQRWWSLPVTPVFPDARWTLPPAARRWTWLVAGAVTILAMWPRSARLNQGLHPGEIQALNDAYALSREHPAPRFDAKAEPTGSLRLVEDHIAARFAVDALGQTLRDDASGIDLRKARTLPWIAGLVAAGLIVILAAALGNPRAGLAAGLVAAMHPLAVRCGSEVSDVPLHMLWLGLALVAAIHALQTNQWRWWFLLAAAQGLRLLGDSMAWVDLAALNAGALLVVLTAQTAPQVKSASALRLPVALAPAGVALLFPSVAANRTGELHGMADILSGYSAPALHELLSESAWRLPAFKALLPLAVFAGIYFLLRQDWRGKIAAVLAAAGLVSAPAALLLLPLALVWAGAGLTALAPRNQRLAHAPLLLAVLFVFATSPILQRVMKLPVNPLREAVAAARAEREPGTVVAAIGPDPATASVYGGPLEFPVSVEALDALVDSAFAKEHPLYVLFRSGGADTRLNDTVEKSGRFIALGEFSAFEPRQSLRLYRYQPREQIIRMKVQPPQ